MTVYTHLHIPPHTLCAPVLQGLLRRCIEYEYGQELLDLGLPSSSLPQDECISMADLDCSRALRPLISGLDLLNHTEIRNTDDTDRCKESECYVLCIIQQEPHKPCPNIITSTTMYCIQLVNILESIAPRCLFIQYHFVCVGLCFMSTQGKLYLLTYLQTRCVDIRVHVHATILGVPLSDKVDWCMILSVFL